MNKLHCDFCDRAIGENETVYGLSIYQTKLKSFYSKTERSWDLCKDCKGIFDVLIDKCIETIRKEIRKEIS